MAKVSWRGGAMLSPVPPALITCSDGERENVFTVAWTGIVNTIPPKTYISVRPSRYSYDIIKKGGVFAINLTTAELVRAADYCGVHTGAQAVRLYLREGEQLEMVKADIRLLRAAEQASRPIYEKA